MLLEYRPRASLLPAVLDLTDCPYMWPHCMTPVYAHRLPLLLNTTILNGMGLIGALYMTLLLLFGIVVKECLCRRRCLLAFVIGRRVAALLVWALVNALTE